MAGEYRNELRPGMRVAIVRKQDQRSGTLTVGTIDRLLTSKPYHSRGIKVRLEDGKVGRVRQIDPGAEG
ncbi:YwbE family protein [Desulfuromonas carbonis]|nr:YwbE family protein [Desulfuromonas sp. DDH964]AMV70496.1 hypothetical protein DBW_0095 [Desulfuromonas sp. DDH964]